MGAMSSRAFWDARRYIGTWLHVDHDLLKRIEPIPTVWTGREGQELIREQRDFVRRNFASGRGRRGFMLGVATRSPNLI